MSLMAKKKKPTGGRHTTPRQTMQFPADWLAAIRAEARTEARPALWYLLMLVRKDLEAKGRADIPPMPWEEPPDEPAETKPRR
jgi:DNA-binding FadR family transcriptional regulator